MVFARSIRPLTLSSSIREFPYTINSDEIIPLSLNDILNDDKNAREVAAGFIAEITEKVLQ